MFEQVMRLFLGEGQLHPNLFTRMGFVQANDIQCIKDVSGGHSFRLVHLQGHWHIFSSFFGGRIGSYVFFPGPNYECWSCADIVAPINSKDWGFVKAPITQSIAVRAEWKNLAEIVPSFELQKSVSTIRADVVRHSRK
jgi:hypothetical protein